MHIVLHVLYGPSDNITANDPSFSFYTIIAPFYSFLINNILLLT